MQLDFVGLDGDRRIRAASQATLGVALVQLPQPDLVLMQTASTANGY